MKPALAVGFLSGQEVTWLAEATRLQGADLRNIEMVVSSERSPDLADGLSMGRLDAAFMRAEPDRQDLEYIPVARERFVVVMPSDHRLTAFDPRCRTAARLCGEPPASVGYEPPAQGEPPTIDLVVGYNRANTSPTLALFLSRVEPLKK